MKTLLTTSVDEAAAIIRLGGLVAFPTETVYGLGADALNASAVGKIFAAKMRPADNPLIVHIFEIEQLADLTSFVPNYAHALMNAFFPGPLTLVLPRSRSVPDVVTAGLESVAIRMPSRTFTREFLAACETPVAAPSANLSGRPSPTTWQAVAEDLDGRIDAILQGEPADIGLESTVVDATGEAPVILRLGSITLDAIKAVVPSAVMHTSNAEAAVKSPGMCHRHYSPRAKVVLIDDVAAIGGDTSRSSLISIAEVQEQFAFAIRASDVESYASQVFEFFRESDRRAVDAIYCEKVSETGIGAALMDRLRRASEG